ncbi:MAG: TRAP transporter permease [Pikeienuella sp.]
MATWVSRAALALGFALAVQAIWTASQGTFNPTYHRTIVFALCALALVLHRPLAVRLGAHGALAAAAWAVDVAVVGVIGLGVDRFIAMQAQISNMLVDFSTTDQWIALAALIATLELTRREFGAGLTLVASVVLAYCLFGENLPGVLQHAGFTLSQVAEGMWYGFQGVFGMPASVVIDLLYIYIVFGLILEATGAGEALIKIAVRVTGRIPGGAAHAAIFASTLFGSMSGSVTANVAGTGAFTIPLMRQKGFRPEFAGAVEAAASTAGQFIPPVMGAVAFMLAQLTGVNYLLVCAAALVPAFAYIGALVLAVYLEAKRMGLGGEDVRNLPRLTRADLVRSLTFALPVLTVVFVMLMGRSPAQAGFWATVAAIAMGLVFNPELRRKPALLARALARGGLSGAKIMIAVGAIGIVVAGFNLTGLGLSFSQMVGGFGSDNLILSLLLTALACIALGMGMPTLPAYLIIVLVMGPSLTSMGAPKLAAHMFVLYYAVLSAITPPVALAAFAAAPLADASPMRIAVVAMRLTLIGFIAPFLFVYNPSLLLVLDFNLVDFGIGILRIILVIWALSAGLAGYGIDGKLSPAQRGLHLAGAGFAVLVGTGADLTGLALIVALILIALFRNIRPAAA